MILEEKEKTQERERGRGKKDPPHFSWPFFFQVMTPTQFGMTRGEREREVKQKMIEKGGLAGEGSARDVEMAEWKGVEKGGVGEKEREMGLAVCGVNGRSARLTNIKMCTGDAGVTRLAR